MSKREEIDQLKHDYFMLSKRVESLENQMRGLLPGDQNEDFKPLAGKTLADVQNAWHENNNTVLHGSISLPPDIKHFEQKAHQPKIRDLTKKDVSPQTEQVYAELQKKGPKPFAHPRRGVGG
jgi:hypothetical protein